MQKLLCRTDLSSDPLIFSVVQSVAQQKIFRTDDHCSGLPSLGLVIQCIPLNKYCTPFRLAIPD